MDKESEKVRKSFTIKIVYDRIKDKNTHIREFCPDQFMETAPNYL